jgi:uncharacterized protein (TIGR02246 family)
MQLTLRAVALATATLLASVAAHAQSSSAAAIDADVWKPVAASVVDGDIVAMGRVYHPDAVLVSSAGTRLISRVLPEWGKDIAENKAIGTRATVEFRFTSRQSDAESAFETGVFKYTVIDKSGRSTPSYRRLESLMVKHQGKWRIVMERQLEAVTEATWNSMRP